MSKVWRVNVGIDSERYIGKIGHDGVHTHKKDTGTVLTGCVLMITITHSVVFNNATSYQPTFI